MWRSSLEEIKAERIKIMIDIKSVIIYTISTVSNYSNIGG